MTAWATTTQARSYWADANGIADADLDVLLDISTQQCAEYAPKLSKAINVSLVSGSTTVTAVGTAYFVDFDIGAAVTGTGIPGGTTVLSVAGATSSSRFGVIRDTGSTAVLSAAATLDQTSILSLARVMPTRLMLGCVYQAREIWAAAVRDQQDVIGIGDYAIRARPLTAAVKQLLRPQAGVRATG